MKWKNKEVKTKTKSQLQHVVLYLCCFDCSVDEVEARSLIGVSHDRLDRMVTRRYTTETVRINTSASDHFSINPISCTDADYGSGKRPGLKTPRFRPPIIGRTACAALIGPWQCAMAVQRSIGAHMSALVNSTHPVQPRYSVETMHTVGRALPLPGSYWDI